MPPRTDYRLRDAPEAVFRRQVLDRTALALAFLIVAGVLARHLSSPVRPPQLLIVIGLASLALSTPILTRRLKHGAVAALPVCVTLLALVIGAGLKFGGLQAPIVAMLPILPVLGFFFGGKRLANALLVATLAVAAGLLAAGANGLVEQMPGGPGDERTRAVVLSMLVLGGYAAGAIYERSRRIAEAHLVEASRLVSLGVMAGGIAHEINNPLTIVAGYSSQLADMASQRELDPVVVGRLAERLVVTTKRVADIVSGLRTYSRDDTREPLRPCGLAQILDDTLALCSERFHGSDIALRVGAFPAELTVMARPVQITQVLLNLLNNAFDAASESTERWVALEVAASTTTFTISIIDSGPGVPTALRAKIFVPFFTTKEVGKGTGLGLSLCASIMSEHGGQVSLSSAAKRTTFVLCFPIAATLTTTAA